MARIRGRFFSTSSDSALILVVSRNVKMIGATNSGVHIQHGIQLEIQI